MAIYKVVSGHKYTLTGAINYTRDTALHNDKILCSGGYGVSPTNPIEDMLFVKQCFNKPDGNEYYHIVLSLEENEHPNQDQLVSLFEEYGNYIYISTGCQVSFSIHGSTNHLHCHYIINSVTMVNGNKLNFDYSMFYNLRTGIDILLFKHGLQPLRKIISEKKMKNHALLRGSF